MWIKQYYGRHPFSDTAPLKMQGQCCFFFKNTQKLSRKCVFLLKNVLFYFWMLTLLSRIVPVNIKINGILIFLWHLNFCATPYVRYVADKCLLKIKNVNYLNLLNVVPNVFKVNNQFSLDFSYVFLIYLTRFWPMLRFHTKENNRKPFFSDVFREV